MAAGLRNGSALSLELGAKPPSDSAVVTVVLVTGNSTEVKYGPADAGVREREVELTVSLQDTVEDLRDQAGVLLLAYAPGWTRRSEVLTRGTGARDHRGEEVDLPASIEERDVATAAVISTLPPSDPSTAEPSQEPSQAISGPQDQKLAAAAEFGTVFSGRRLRRTTWLKEPTDLTKESVEETVQNKPTPGPAKKGASKAGAQSAAVQVVTAAAGPSTVRRAITVKEAGIKSGDTLLLEEGTLPVEGKIELQVTILDLPYKCHLVELCS